MTSNNSNRFAGAMDEAIEHLTRSLEARKCWSCGCFRGTLDALDRSFVGEVPAELAALLRTARERLQPTQYDCLGCDVCHPPTALNALERAGLVEPSGAGICCLTEKVEEREGWPPLPGEYKVLRYTAPVAVCTLTDEALVSSVAARAPAPIAIVGSLQTENLGIERVISNLVGNPNLRFLILCGADSKRAVGHLPGQSLLALMANGVDEDQRIIGAPGRKPVLANVSREAVEHFRKTVEVVDLVGTAEMEAILGAVEQCAAKDRGPAELFAPGRTVEPIPGYTPPKAVLDAAGFFVVYADRRRNLLCLEHYRNDGVLNAIVEGKTAVEVYYPAIDRGFVTRLDHAAYLGRELAKAERALATGEEYVQDAAPETPDLPKPLFPMGCGCGPTCD